MPETFTTFDLLGIVVLAAPAVLVAVLGVTSLLGRTLSEDAIARILQTGMLAGLVAAVGVFALMLVRDVRHVTVTLGDWVVLGDGPGGQPVFHYSVKFVFDRLSVPLAVLSFTLCGVIGAFARKYMHREPGYNRFFTLYTVFVLGMVVTSLADTIETLFAGWELVGLSSALLVAFFQHRPAPARNAFRVWVVYRISDAALLLAAVVMHHVWGGGDFEKLLGAESWPDGHATVTGLQVLAVGGLLLIAAAGKSALVPFSGWLPRAMEGPTPSSAVFYGALSVHLGVYLLLRVGPLIDSSPILAMLVVTLGLVTAAYAYLAGSVQTDIKSALSFASLTQVGLIVAEIGLGFRYVALVHLIGHACLRTPQFLRAPTLLQDYRGLENAIGGRLPRGAAWWERVSAGDFGSRLYRFAVERGHLDALLGDYVASPFVRLFRWFDRLERRWTDFLSRRASRESDAVRPRPEEVEQFL